MEPTMKRIADNQVQLYDDQGQLIGTIVRPVVAQVTGPGAEKVYLARQRTDRPSKHAA